MTTPKEARLLIQANYPHDVAILEQVLSAIKNFDLQISHLYQKELAPVHALSLEVSGVWHQISKLETYLDELSQKTDAHFYWQRLNEVADDTLYLPYIMQVQTLINADVIQVLTEFFGSRGIKLKDVLLERYVQSKTLVPMQSFTLHVYLPVTMNLPELRENLIILCEQYNLDVIFEQDRS